VDKQFAWQAGGRRAEAVQHGRAAGGPAPLTGFLLGGLTTVEVLAAVIAFAAVMGFLWTSGTAQPGELVTDRWIRAGWAIAVAGILRPVTWIPYVGAFVLLRRVVRAIGRKRRPVTVNMIAHVLTVALMVAALWLLAVAIPAAWTGVVSVTAVLTGGGALQDVGTAAGHWGTAQFVLLGVLVLVVRPVLPPIDPDLGLSDEPVLGFPSGPRGRFDRVALLVAVIGGGMLVGAGALLLRG